MPFSFQPNQRARVFLSSMGLLPFVSVWKAAAFALAELGCAAFFIAGVVPQLIGPAAPWFVLAACVFGVVARQVDVESWALFIPGALVGRSEQAFGERAGRAVSTVVLLERFLLAALAAAVLGRYIANVEELSTQVAMAVVGLLWIRARSGLDLKPDTISKGVWLGVSIVAVAAIWSIVTGVRPGAGPVPLPYPPVRSPVALVFYGFGLAVALPVLGTGGALARVANQLAPPRVQALRRTSALIVAFSFIGIAIPAFAFVAIVPIPEQAFWAGAPLAGLARHLVGAGWARTLISLAVVVAAFLMLVPAANAALLDADKVLRRAWSTARSIDIVAAFVVLIIFASAGQVTWLGRAYAFAIGFRLLVKIAVLVRLRRKQPGTRPYKVGWNVTIRSREYPIGLWISGAVAFLAVGSLLLVGDGPAMASAALVGVLAFALSVASRRAPVQSTEGPGEAFELLPASDLSLGQVEARPGNVLVAVRNRGTFAHVEAAFQAAHDRDVVVMTARVLGTDVEDEPTSSSEPTAAEQQLLVDVVAVAERYQRPVRLLIVPTRNVFDAVVATILRLQSSELYVGESSSLSADDQARLLGEAWETADKPDNLNVRLVIYHNSGRAGVYHIGAHPPSLTPKDLELIHRVWLDATKAIGPHVHHRDVVRAALAQMEEQLTGPQRDAALEAIRQTARPADELAAAVRERDFSRLRDTTRNRPASDLATTLTDLSLEDQVVVFRLLPRKDAAAVFEYLEPEQQESLLKAMAQEDVAALLNNMAPDDRTAFLEELPAAATRQLLSLLTPAERAVALTLLGYREESIGRLMTPHYVAVREQWTIREALDYIRAHGQHSETLNVIYVVDQQGMLVDDIGIRELLLTSLDARIADLMDRRFVALKATDDGQTAVQLFRQHDRTALPVTDTAGMLIGIVTIDDVLDVAEAAATAEIQRIGGSEALDEPYMKIGMLSMVQKRAGWLTVLFIGEMLTATAMAFFEAEISRAVVLAMFVPLIISSGGNSGSQASTLAIRALALGEVGLHDWWRVARREIIAGLSLGAILGSLGFMRITLWSTFSNTYGAHWLLVAITVAVALIGVVLWGTLMGSLLPFVLRRLGFDPATSSAPFVATLVDVTGLVIYFTVASVILKGTLL
ncbi:MAG: magnesium transporter [Vicinamibacterales bacterium]|nr:magnesium transporter [Vicinamibacterales bacterium]